MRRKETLFVKAHGQKTNRAALSHERHAPKSTRARAVGVQVRKLGMETGVVGGCLNPGDFRIPDVGRWVAYPLDDCRRDSPMTNELELGAVFVQKVEGARIRPC